MSSYSLYHPTATLILFLFLFSPAYTLDLSPDGTGFIFPTEGLTLHYNDYVLVDYVSNFSTPYLKVWCSSNELVLKKFSQEVGAFNNTATVKLNWTGSATPCWFNLVRDSSDLSNTRCDDGWSVPHVTSVNINDFDGYQHLCDNGANVDGFPCNEHDFGNGVDFEISN
ncbi:hypothetical protein VMCG_07976 [Cytospora schulzeri]|uniref:AA1-like domain-containing protein n=1 Tax=Cytospora schulzeri TaxID=448051 RepID=A0A423VYA5_9PEZI|nr:hypothetical protein VMCG_07976 [Valsa malicola]